MTLTAPQELEHDNEVPSDTPDEQAGQGADDLYSDARRSEVRNVEECQDQGIVTERPPAVAPEHVSNDDHPRKDTQHTDRSRGECRFPRNILAINACQL